MTRVRFSRPPDLRGGVFNKPVQGDVLFSIVGDGPFEMATSSES